MKQNLRRLNNFLRIFGVKNVYQCDFNRFGCTIYSHKTKEVEQWLKVHHFALKQKDGWNINKWVRGKYTIILN